MGKSSDPAREVRRANVFRLFVAGKSYRAIAAELAIDKDTVTDDVRALTGRLDTWATQQKTRALSYVVATYQRIIDEAWAAYDDECERERRWIEGDFDREHQVPDPDGGVHKELKPPPFKSLKVAWLNTIRETCAAYSKLAGVDAPQKVEVTGKDGGEMVIRVEYEEVGHGRDGDDADPDAPAAA